MKEDFTDRQSKTDRKKVFTPNFVVLCKHSGAGIWEPVYHEETKDIAPCIAYIRKHNIHGLNQYMIKDKNGEVQA